MRKLKQEVPQDWVCESCLSGNLILTKSGGKDDNLVTSSDLRHHNVMKFSGWRVHSKKQKPVETGKVKFIPHEEVVKLSSGATQTRSPSMVARSLKPGCTWTTSKRNPPKSIDANTKFFSDRVICKRLGLVRPSRDDAVPKSSMVNQHLSQSFNESKASERTSLGNGKWHAHQKQQTVAFLVPTKDVETSRNKLENFAKKSSHAPLSSRPVDTEKKAAAPCTKEPVTKIVTQPVVKESRTLLPSRDLFLDVSAGGKDVVERSSSNVQEGELQTLTLPASYGLYRTYLPALVTTWKGGFSILDGTASEIFSGFQAQPSRKVQLRAYETSRKMPPVIQAKMLPQFQFLADLFEDDCPDLQDVALYFFPADNVERSRQKYEQLLEHMETHESIMIGYINDVELLIFTSKQLNVDSQNILSYKSKHFFWGVFRSTNDKAPSNALEELPTLVSPLARSYDKQEDTYNNKADDDMEIDMVGGKDIGRVDIVVPRNLPTLRSTELSKTIPDGVPQEQNPKSPISGEIGSLVQKLVLEVKRDRTEGIDKTSALTHMVGSVKHHQEHLPSSPPGFAKRIKSEPGM
ncbi:hypothetical protein TorRG33x02_345590 [Trema orientale]|uniref:AIPP2-like SPOC-like domain-containing protein n=1 Tax=Trema orientale TaxID=63057 RepID=A0A2P5ANY3_TREOI|nr:hypothetical protein TorRG33x02_345590 [Trema orientale]